MIEKATAKRSAGRPYEDVPTPALGEGAFIRVRCISARHKDEYEVGFWTHTDGSVAMWGPIIANAATASGMAMR